MKVLVTGASGFVGRRLVEVLSATADWTILAATRRPGVVLPGRSREIVLPPGVAPSGYWEKTLRGVDMVVHLAGRAHVMKESAHDPLSAYRAVNRDLTRTIAEAAATSGVKLFVYMSTVKVHGENGHFTEDSLRAPVDAYGRSKFEAEEALSRVASESGLGYTIIRPPLVYGPGVRANFLKLLTATVKGVPLPLGAIENSRSLVSLNNLCDFVSCCLQRREALNHSFLVSDGVDLSTPDLVRVVAAAAGRQARLVSVPAWLLKGVAAGVGWSASLERLTGSLTVSIEKARNVLGWIPPESVESGVYRTVKHLQRAGSSSPVST